VTAEGQQEHWKKRRRRWRKQRWERLERRRQQRIRRAHLGPIARLRRRRAQQPGPPAPFVIGMTRSGTTLMRLMLDSHPELTIPPESHFIPRVIETFNAGRDSPAHVARVITGSRRWADFGIPAGELEHELRKLRPVVTPEMAARTFYRLYAKRQGKSRWGDKTPGYATKVRRINRTLPEARFIHMIRDGRDVAISLRDRDAGLSMEQVARRWRHRINRTRRAAQHVPDYIEIRYEDLVADPEGTLRRICEHIELDYSPKMLDYHTRAPERLAELGRELPAEESKRGLSAESRLEAHSLTAEPPRTDRAGRWRNEMSEADLAIFEEHAGELLRDLGYETPGSEAPVGTERR
jgi:hypothetical protein